RGGDDVKDADERLLLHATRERAGGRQQRGSDRREEQRVGITGGAVHRVADDHSHRGTERRDLRQREIGEYHVPPQHLEAEPGVNAGKDHGGGERQRREGEDFLEHLSLSSTRPTKPAPACRYYSRRAQDSRRRRARCRRMARASPRWLPSAGRAVARPPPARTARARSRAPSAHAWWPQAWPAGPGSD